MKIAIVLGGLEKGGAERVVCNLSNYFIEENNEVMIICNTQKNQAYEINEKVSIKTLDEAEKINGFVRKNFKKISLMKKIIVDYKPNIILCFLQEPTARMLILKTFSLKIKKIPVIVSVRIDPKVAFNSIKRKLSLPLYNKADGFVFQTIEAQNFFNHKIQSRSAVIENSVNPIFYSLKFNEDNNSNKIISVGRLTKQKNFPLLIRSFKSFDEKIPGYELEIYGQGELKESLNKLINDLNLSDKIHLMGNVNNIQDKILNSKLFVISSDYEGMSNALMEAMTIGIPCISTNSTGGGAETLITNGENGILVPVNNEEELVRNMIWILNNHKLYSKISKKSKLSMERYSPEVINKKWLDYINNNVRR